MLEHAEVHARLRPYVKFAKVDEIPSDFQRRRKSVVVAENEGAHILICEGAVEEVYAACNRVAQHGHAVMLEEAHHEQLLAVEHASLLAKHVHVIPPNVNMGIVNGVLNLSPRPPARAPHQPIDVFFESLARNQRERVIGVILSGTATDGTLGLDAVKPVAADWQRRVAVTM